MWKAAIALLRIVEQHYEVLQTCTNKSIKDKENAHAKTNC